MKNLLFIAYTFPPVSTGSAPLNLRLMDIFVRNGWRPNVITTDKAGNMPMDPSLISRLPENVEILRIGGTSPRNGRGKRKFRRTPTAGRRRGLRKFLLETMLQPDRYITWFPWAFTAALDRMDETDADLIITLGPPHSVHLVGMTLSLFSGKPWVAYFGDLWAMDGCVDWNSLSPVRRGLTPLFEKKVISSANGIITTTPGSTRYFRETYGRRCPPAHTLWNGVTSRERKALWNPDAPRYPGREFVITYTGFFMGKQTPEYFLRGFKLFLEKHPEFPVKFRVAGEFGAFENLPVDLGIENNVELLGPVPFGKVRKYQIDSDVLLLLLPPDRGNELKNPSKTVEYLLARRPILAVAPPGDLTNLIRTLGAGYTASHDPESICGAIEEIHDDISKGRFRILMDPSELGDEMDMDKGGLEMAAFLSEITAGKTY